MAKRIDANQHDIVEALRAIGASVETGLTRVGHGCPDLLIGYHGRDYVMEVKNGNARLTAAEEDWMRAWQGQYFVVRDAEEAIKIVQYWSGEA